ncbi:MAG: motility protein A [Candidatus Hydrogenedentota bacterium]
MFGINLTTILGLILGVGSVFLSGAMEVLHLNPKGINPFLKPSAIIVIFGGTIGATMLGISWSTFLRIPKLLWLTLKEPKYDPKQLINTFVSFAEKARREGILTLEADLEEIEDLFFKKGLQLVVDGVDPETVKALLENEIENTKLRHKEGMDVFNQMGGYAPTMGIVGTVLGLIAALAMAAAGEETGKVVGAIATAFIATFYGISSANLIFLPLQEKLKVLDEVEERYRELVMFGLISLMSGDNPGIVNEKLSVFLRKRERYGGREEEAQEKR